MFKTLRDWFTKKSDLIYQKDKWEQRAVCLDEKLDYQQQVTAFYRKKWNEALRLLPPEVQDRLTETVEERGRRL